MIDDPVFLKLQFTSQWIDAGVITADYFELIRQEYLTGEDQNTEHYRWGAFRNFLKNNSYISRDSFFAIYELGRNDPDYSMGRAMRFDLIKRSDCPMELINTAINDTDTALAKHALKYKKLRDASVGH
jgi:hypothetical protein